MTAHLDASAQLWVLAKRQAAKRRTLTHAQAAAGIPGLALMDVQAAAWPIHVWCWVKGLPPLNVVVVESGTKARPDGGFDATDYDVHFEALGYSVYTLDAAFGYPWAKVADPTPEDLAWALRIHAQHAGLLREHRRLDLELELRHSDEARGRRRPVPEGCASWDAAERQHLGIRSDLTAVGIDAAALRPGRTAPYPPPRPSVNAWAH